MISHLIQNVIIVEVKSVGRGEEPRINNENIISVYSPKLLFPHSE